MATAKLYNLARMTTATTGTGTITLGSAVTGFISFATAGIADGDVVTYAIEDGNNREIGRGTYTASGTTLTRSVLKSTNAGSAINLSGTAQVFITNAAEDHIAGPASATDNAVVRFDGTGGATIQNSVVTVADTTGTLSTSGGGDLGVSSTAPWGSLFMASGKKLDFNAGDVTVTHSANALAFAGASSGYTFDAAPLPSANDGAALGASGTAWADLFLASGGVINWNAGNVTLTHAAGALTVAGATTFSLGTSAALTTGTIELGAASDTTLARSAAGTVTVEGSQVLLAGQTATISKGFAVTAYSGGTVSSGTFTVDPANHNVQYYTNGGAHTLAAPSSDCEVDVLVTNNGSAGAITFSGFTVGSSTGSALTTTNTNKFIISVKRINGTSTYSVYALQ